MRLVSWVRFTWNLKSLPESGPALQENYVVRRANKSEEKAVQRVIQTSVSLDSDWVDTPSAVIHNIDVRVKDAFTAREPHIPCLVLCHGARIVGASVLNFDPEATTHLITGPCILLEYKNRGLGSVMLYESLVLLKAAGLEFAHGVTKKNVPSSKFVYPKFEGTSAEFDAELELVS